MILNTNAGEESLEGEVSCSVVSHNGGDFKTEFYPLTEEELLLLAPVKEGWTFLRWVDENGEEMTAEALAHGKRYYADWIDLVPPDMELLCSKDTANMQTVTIKAHDIASAIGGYYAGMENPDEMDVVFVSTSEEAFEVPITQAGEYYFAVRDSCENKAVSFLKFIQITLQPGEGEACEQVTILGREGDTILLPEAQKRGHDYIGWVNEEWTEPILEYVFSKEVTLSPLFVPSKYQIHLDTNGGTCEIESVTATFGETYPQLPDAQRKGYHFIGWTKEKDGEILSGEETYELDGNSTLYAKWKPITYTVRYQRNGGEQGEMEDVFCTYDVAFVHPRNNFTRTGYVFKGWSLSPDTISTQNALTARDRSYNGAEWLNEDEAMNLSSEADAVVDLYAIWQKIEVGVMDYRYCMGNYMYFACTTLNYRTENSADNGAVFVGMTPAGGKAMQYGDSATWATSMIRASLNDSANSDMTGIKTTDTTVNYSYAGNMWNYDPTSQSPCTYPDCGYGPRIYASGVNRIATEDYFFIPDLRDCYNYYSGNSWNWFWDINLDGTPDTTSLYGMHTDGPDASYYDLIDRIRYQWAQMGWPGRCWLRNQYTGYANYPFYTTEYGVSSCNPTDLEYRAAYENLAIVGRYLVRPMYTMVP